MGAVTRAARANYAEKESLSFAALQDDFGSR